MSRISFLLLFCLLLSTAQSVKGAEIPYLTGRVNDNARIMSDSTRKSLSAFLKDHEARTTNQVVLLTIPSLDGESIEDYSNRVFNEWKLGQKGKDNGILVVVVPGERRMRIEVGYGLEASMTDLTAGRIIDEVMVPRFREGDFNKGITDGVKAVVSVLDGNELPETTSQNVADNSSENTDLSGLENPDLSWTERILFGAFIFGIIGLFTIIGVLTPGVGWFLYLFLIPFWAMFPIIVVGTKGAFVCLITYLILYPAAKLFLKNKEWYKKAKNDLRTKGKASVGGFLITSGGSGSSWSSGGSSGGFSGGGGSSGGGGASGSW